MFVKLGGEKKELALKKQTKIMMLGLYGAGKTTHTGKLALYYLFLRRESIMYFCRDSERGVSTC